MAFGVYEGPWAPPVSSCGALIDREAMKIHAEHVARSVGVQGLAPALGV
jgi:hypothetical protein